LRTSYIYVPKKNITFKTFLANNIVTPSFFQDSFEFSYSKGNHKISLLAGWNKIKDKILFNYWKTFNIDITGSPVEGGYVRLFKNFEKTYFYSDLVYRKGYEIFGTKVGDSYDLSMAISHDLNDSVRIAFKGQNLLNNSIKTVFYIPTLMGIKPLRTLDRKYIFSITTYF